MDGLRKPLWWVKLTHFEYWPFMVLYFPTAFYWMYLILRSRSLTFFTLANPIEEFGSFFGESKARTLQKMHPRYLPASFRLPLNTPLRQTMEKVAAQGIGFPYIIKPDWGERGVNVEVVRNEEELRHYLGHTDRDSIIQEYVDYPIELGVFYHRYPDGSGSNITGIVEKQLMTVTGNGRSTVLELMEQRDRARLQIDRLKKSKPKMLKKVIPEGEIFLLEPIGNHNRGTKFLDGSGLITDELVRVFDDIASSLDGFYYGRFDVKVKSWESMYKGEGIKVLELNGAYSEPAHIYDPNYKLANAYREIIRHMRIIYDLSRQNRARGYRPSPASQFIKLVWRNFFRNKQVV